MKRAKDALLYAAVGQKDLSPRRLMTLYHRVIVTDSGSDAGIPACAGLTGKNACPTVS
ncbi:MAG: hypothetical protein IH935_03480 [Acidobacteria bacterium]|nr:hypothetical protein [Acidobacteriota bacterium]